MSPVRHRTLSVRAASIAALAVVLALATAGFAPAVSAAPDSPQDSAAPSSNAALTPDQALRQAEATGQPVPIEGATTATDTLTANPNGTLTATRTAVPVRERIGTAWATLDPTLTRNGDGSITTTVTASKLSLSPGGTGPLATMTFGTHSLALSLPMTLPAPTLSGATASYPAVLPGVDLQVTANSQGGFSDVFIVHDASAAANPALKTLTLTAQTNGLTLTADTANNLTVTDHGNAVFTASTPFMWDSSRTGRWWSAAGCQHPVHVGLHHPHQRRHQSGDTGRHSIRFQR